MEKKMFFIEERSLLHREIPNNSLNLEKEVYNGEELFNLQIKTIPCLVEPIIPKYGIIALVGSSDVGKSTLLLQLCCDIALNKEFIEFPIQAKHRRAIYVSTEDDKDAISFRMQRLVDVQTEKLKNIRFIFDSENLLESLEGLIAEEKVDLIVIDTFADIFSGEMNQINKVRSFMNDYHNLAKKHECLIVFNHHTGKYTEERAPSKNHSIGSAGFEGKARLVMELRQDYSSAEIRQLCIVKGNYLGSEFKNSSFELKFNNVSGFYRTGNRVNFSALAKPKVGRTFINRDIEKQMAIDLHKEGKSVREIEKAMKGKGHIISKSTVAEWLKSMSIENLTKE